MRKKIDELTLNEFVPECSDKFTQVIVEKTDLDTIGSFFLHQFAGRVEENCPITTIRGKAKPEELTNPQTLCLECGGSGQTSLGNFDHHDPEGPDTSATWQTYQTLPTGKRNLYLEHICRYIDHVDRLGPRELKEKYQNSIFPTLSDIISGINLKHSRTPAIALQEGTNALKSVLKKQEKPTGPISGFEEYAKLKKQNDEQIESVRQNVKFIKTKKGNQVGFLETTFFGAPGVIYEEGSKKFGPGSTIIAVAHNPQFGPEKNENKFTIGLNLTPQQAKDQNISLKNLADFLNQGLTDQAVNLSEGKSWGGPPTGTIIGSPKGGSQLNLSAITENISRLY